MPLRFYRSPKTRAYHWRVTAPSRGRRVLADSGEGYKREIDCRHGLLLTVKEMVLAITKGTVKAKA